eukprot:scaffold46411_cov45-Prasinocladus_malaysianus.AAC.1
MASPCKRPYLGAFYSARVGVVADILAVQAGLNDGDGARECGVGLGCRIGVVQGHEAKRVDGADRRHVVERRAQERLAWLTPRRADAVFGHTYTCGNRVSTSVAHHFAGKLSTTCWRQARLAKAVDKMFMVCGKLTWVDKGSTQLTHHALVAGIGLCGQVVAVALALAVLRSARQADAGGTLEGEHGRLDDLRVGLDGVGGEAV